MALDADLAETARAWLADDPDPQTAGELSALIVDAEAGKADALAELADAFDGTLQFGTASFARATGSRKQPDEPRGGGSGRRRAGRLPEVHRGTSIVVGYDARRNSDVFARDTARIMASAGITAMVLPRPLPTPVLAFAIRELGCDAGVMVTASHNPPDDNGYKVYLGDGSQIVPPADAGSPPASLPSARWTRS